MHPLRTADDPVRNTWLHRILVVLTTFGGLYGTYLLIVVVVTVPRLTVQIPSDSLLLYKITTWFYLASHFVSFTLSDLIISAEYTFDVSLIPGWHGVLYLLPPLGLMIAGFWTARRTYNPADRGVFEGMKLVVVYFPIVFFLVLFSFYTGALPVQQSGLSEGVIRTDVFGGVLYAGIVYPIVFGGIGGLLPTVVDAYLDRTTSGPIHRLDRFLQKRDARKSESEPEPGDGD